MRNTIGLKNLFLQHLFFALVIIFFFCTESAYSEPLVAKINKKTLELTESPQEYSILVSGHIYGEHSDSLYPSASLLANIDSLNQQSPKFMVLLGDIVQIANKEQFKILQEDLLMKFKFPVFNAPGNHDKPRSSTYHDYFGETYYSFVYGQSLFIVLDSEKDDGDIKGEQLEFLKDQLDRKVDNIFIFSHRLIWAIDQAPYTEIIPLVNGPHHHTPRKTNFTKIILPEIKSLKDKNIYFLSGDIGRARCPYPFFYEKDKSLPITYIATGIGDTPKDAVLKITINAEGKVRFTPISLTNSAVEPVETFNLDRWRTHLPKQTIKAKAGSIISKGAYVLTAKRFWYGVIFTLSLVFLGGLVAWLVKKNKRNSSSS